VKLFQWYYNQEGESRDYAYPFLLLKINDEPGIAYFTHEGPHHSPFCVDLSSMNANEFKDYFDHAFMDSPTEEEKHDMVVVIFNWWENVLGS
jgi:hypothetical protein